MSPPDDPRYEEILELADHAKGDGLLDRPRPRWRELVTELLGSIHHTAGTPQERRQALRADVELEVDILEPEELASLATSSVGSGGLSIRIAEVIPVGTPIALSIKLEQRRGPRPLAAHGAGGQPRPIGGTFCRNF